ncbi:Transposon Ty3-G Gag-Pol polyprotein [Sesamum angolense]|uniref:Transposon Ty3-G Gag-Pol polyprotein n=1 Tax=Sesamum angolense TaxID=2727404 RepID=A0AAE1WBU9_9LAMI|nr:Transposon Ty3-G Gag-Pol polyprotein [Sesamum angolense]
MEEDVEAYVRTCLVCQLDKVEKKKEAWLLPPLPIPEGSWQSVSMDFISGFPKVNSMAFIFVVVDRFFKYGIFIDAPNTESVNALVEDYLRHYVLASQQNWVDLLDVAQLCYNLHKLSAMGMSPFELVCGQQPMIPMRYQCTSPVANALQPTGLLSPSRNFWTRQKIVCLKHNFE